MVGLADRRHARGAEEVEQVRQRVVVRRTLQERSRRTGNRRGWGGWGRHLVGHQRLETVRLGFAIQGAGQVRIDARLYLVFANADNFAIQQLLTVTATQANTGAN
ncbi:hypothetical protein D3C79_663990 [compost metagenome]